MVRPVVSPSDKPMPSNPEDAARAVNLVDDTDAGTAVQAKVPVPPEPAVKSGSGSSRKDRRSDDRRGSKRGKKSKQEDLMDPNAPSKGSRDPGDDDVMDPEL